MQAQSAGQRQARSAATEKPIGRRCTGMKLPIGWRPTAEMNDTKDDNDGY